MTNELAKRPGPGSPEPRLHYVHERAPLCSVEEGMLRGLRHRTVIDRSGGAAALALWQEEHQPGFQVPDHFHDCEEIIVVIRGAIEAFVDSKPFGVGPMESILFPARALHGFRVAGTEAVLLLALFASPDPKIFRADGTETTPPWLGGSSDHLAPP